MAEEKIEVVQKGIDQGAKTFYISADKRYLIMRDYQATEYNPHAGGHWVLRDTIDNKLIDTDKYRHDLFERNNIKVVEGN